MSFRFRPALTLSALLGLAVLVSLGGWQLRRLEWKRDLIARVEQRLAAPAMAFETALSRAEAGEDLEYQPVRARGVYAHALSVRVFGVLDGVAGAYVFTPLKIASAEGAPFAFVNRGFAPQDLGPEELARGEVAGEVEVEGLLRAPERAAGAFAFLQPKDQPADGLYFRRDPGVLAAAAAIAAAPLYIDGSGRENPAPWPKGGVTRLEFPNRHLEYALTWFGLAAALLGVYLAFSFRR